MSAKQKLLPRLPRSRPFFFLLIAFVVFLPPVSRAVSLDDAAHELAIKVCAIPRKQPVSVRWQEPSPSSSHWPESAKKAFLNQIAACGLTISENSDAALRLALQITPSRVVLVAESMDAGSGRQVRIVEVPRASLSTTRETSAGPRLNSEFLWQQPGPIESAIEWQDPASQDRFLLLLSESLLLRLRLENGSWKTMDSTELPPPRKRSRSGPGRLIYSRAEKTPAVVLENGKSCELNLAETVSFSCGPSGSPARSLLISTPCDDVRRYLATGVGDDTQADRILLKRAPSDTGLPAAVEDGVPFVETPGPVLSVNIVGSTKAVAVVRNLSTGNYEVYRITAVCGD